MPRGRDTRPRWNDKFARLKTLVQGVTPWQSACPRPPPFTAPPLPPPHSPRGPRSRAPLARAAAKGTTKGYACDSGRLPLDLWRYHASPCSSRPKNHLLNGFSQLIAEHDLGVELRRPRHYRRGCRPLVRHLRCWVWRYQRHDACFAHRTNEWQSA